MGQIAGISVTSATSTIASIITPPDHTVKVSTIRMVTKAVVVLWEQVVVLLKHVLLTPARYLRNATSFLPLISSGHQDHHSSQIIKTRTVLIRPRSINQGLNRLVATKADQIKVSHKVLLSRLGKVSNPETSVDLRHQAPQMRPLRSNDLPSILSRTITIKINSTVLSTRSSNKHAPTTVKRTRTRIQIKRVIMIRKKMTTRKMKNTMAAKTTLLRNKTTMTMSESSSFKRLNHGLGTRNASDAISTSLLEINFMGISAFVKQNRRERQASPMQITVKLSLR